MGATTDILKLAGIGSALDTLGSDSNKLRGDVVGLGMLGATTLDRAVASETSTDSPERESVRGAVDNLGYAAIAAPIAASAVRSRGRGRAGSLIDLAGLGALTVPALDSAQAHVREAFGDGTAKKNLMLPHRAHALLELGGLGTLATSTARGITRGHSLGPGTELLGYGALAAPYALDAMDEDGHGAWQGTPRALTDTVGLGLLAGGAILGHRRH